MRPCCCHLRKRGSGSQGVELSLVRPVPASGVYFRIMNKLLQQSILLLFLLPLLGRAQEMRISGRVVDAKIKDPIPFATINLREEGEGTLSNEFGYFQFTGSKTLSQDSLEFMALGYTRRTTFVEPGRAKDLLIELNRQVIFGMISCPVMPFTIFNTKTTPLPNGEILAGLSGTQYAFFIKNETGK